MTSGWSRFCCFVVCLWAFQAACVRPLQTGQPAPALRVETREMAIPSGSVTCDLYQPASAGPHPLVIVAHGFSRSRANMAGWGRHLAELGFLTIVPDLPAWSDQERNGRAVRELIDRMLSSPPASVDPARIAVMGFSAGGLATLLAAADDPRIQLWIGLDPVDRNRQGAMAAPRVKGRAVILRAEPSRCNANGNAASLAEAFGDRATSTIVAGATHTDPEWPTDWLARMVCGGDDETRRAKFVEAATAALKQM